MEGFIRAIIENKIMGTFHITTSECLRWDEILDIYKEAIKKYTGIDIKVYILKNVSQYYGARNVPNSYTYDRLYDRKFDNSKLENLLSGENHRNYENIHLALDRCVKNFLVNPTFREISWIHEAAMDKITGDSTKVSKIRGTKNKIMYILIRYCGISLKNIYPLAKAIIYRTRKVY